MTQLTRQQLVLLLRLRGCDGLLEGGLGDLQLPEIIVPHTHTALRRGSAQPRDLRERVRLCAAGLSHDHRLLLIARAVSTNLITFHKIRYDFRGVLIEDAFLISQLLQQLELAVFPLLFLHRLQLRGALSAPDAHLRLHWGGGRGCWHVQLLGQHLF